jgi:galactokinase/mevalonate kinase-like predicted kinase
MFKKTKLKLIFTACDVIAGHGVTGSSAVIGQLLHCANTIYILFS